MNTEQIFKAHFAYTALTDSAEEIRHSVDHKIEISGYTSCLHMRDDYPSFSFWTGLCINKKNMGATLNTDGSLTFFKYGDYSKVDEYIIKKEFEQQVSR